MTGFKRLLLSGLVLAVSAITAPVFAQDAAHSTPGLSG